MVCIALEIITTLFGAVFGHPNDDTARRYFGRLVSNGDSDVTFSPADFDLYKVGTFDDNNGLISLVTPIEFICNGMEVLNREK